MGPKNGFRGASTHEYVALDEAWDDATDHGAHPAADMTAGLVVGTMVATQDGWRAVETLREGDKVMTFDGGLQPIAGIRHGMLWTAPMVCPEPLWPLSVPAGALGNVQSMTLLPDQPVMVESDTAEDIFGDPFVLVPASVLEGRLGIERVLPAEAVEVVALGFENDEMIYVNGSALAFCPSHIAGTVMPLDELDAERDEQMAYHVLSPMEAHAILGETGSGASEDAPERGSHAA
ncbi:MAG: Hint domain-containing protein [Paracoccaceae bacterium]